MTNKDQVAEALREALALSSVDPMTEFERTQLTSFIRSALRLLTAPVPEAPGAEEYQYARTLLLSLHAKHYGASGIAPLPDLAGVLTQIDNLTTGLARVPESPSSEEIEAIKKRRERIHRDPAYHDYYWAEQSDKDCATLLSALDAERAARVEAEGKAWQEGIRNACDTVRSITTSDPGFSPYTRDVIVEILDGYLSRTLTLPPPPKESDHE